MQTVAVGGEEQTETHEEHVQIEFLAGGFGVGFFLHELSSVPTRT